MARIRYLKPDFFLDEDVGYLTVNARLGFQGLWVHADREGRLEDRPRLLKTQIFPYDDIDMESVLEELSKPKVTGTKKPFIVRYEVNDCKYIQIISFLKHQKPHHTEKKSVIPPIPDGYLTVNSRLKDGEYPVGMGKGIGIGKRKKKIKIKGSGIGSGMGSEEGKTKPPVATAANDGGNGLGAIPPSAAYSSQDQEMLRLAKIIDEKRSLMGLKAQ